MIYVTSSYLLVTTISFSLINFRIANPASESLRACAIDLVHFPGLITKTKLWYAIDYKNRTVTHTIKVKRKSADIYFSYSTVTSGYSLHTKMCHSVSWAIPYLTVAPCSIIPIPISISKFFTVFYTLHIKQQFLSCTLWSGFDGKEPHVTPQQRVLSQI